ncbi:MAG: hypothetical protein WC141_08250 [Arcobacteraceae bacterium]
MKKILFITVLLNSFLLASEHDFHEEETKEADCLILKDENSIICKYTSPIGTQDKEIEVEWINPNGESTRKRTVIVPAGHSSVYDFRYISGRLKGIWTFKVYDEEDSVTTTFELK